MYTRIAGLFIIILFFFLIHNNVIEKRKTIELQKAYYEYVEKAYFEGQKDALENDIRITKKDSCWVWIKSPWDNKQKPIYNPSIN